MEDKTRIESTGPSREPVKTPSGIAAQRTAAQRLINLVAESNPRFAQQLVLEHRNELPRSAQVQLRRDRSSLENIATRWCDFGVFDARLPRMRELAAKSGMPSVQTPMGYLMRAVQREWPE